MRLDLHIHSTASDGSWSPEAVVRGAAKGGLDVIALTDHDTIAGYAAASATGREIDVQVIPGVEVSSTHDGRDVHILGYFVNPESPRLLEYTGRASRRRVERMREMLARLAEQGIEIAFDAVEEAAGPDRVVIGRPHLAKALIAAGHASSIPDAFNRLIGDDCAAFVPTHLLTPSDAVELIAGSGGVSVWAHPPGDLVDELLPGLLKAGLRGLEVYRPRHGRATVLRYEGICRTSGLLMSGGSDWHTPEAGKSLGDFFVTGEEVGKLLTVGGM
ncbi:MAG: PHP domain-containing protein [Gemmatimonadota bacterium]